MTTLLAISALIELGAGLALLCCPSPAIMLLVGTAVQEPAVLSVTRVGGSGLFALGIACWIARDDTQHIAARGIVLAMLFYNVATAAFMAFAGLGYGLYGVLLWPGVLIHTIMTIWCLKSLVGRPHL